jgi:hypothetical protein
MLNWGKLTQRGVSIQFGDDARGFQFEVENTKILINANIIEY